MYSLGQKKSWKSKLLIFLHILLGVGAVFGGLVLIIDPSGSLIHMPISIIEQSPFPNFLIPGIILFGVLGVLPLLVAYGLITKKSWKTAERFNLYRDKHWSWTFSLYIGFAVIIWITVEAYIIGSVVFIHLFYIAVGLKIQAVTLLPSVQNYYSVNLSKDVANSGKNEL